jgi:hypothetical protein
VLVRIVTDVRMRVVRPDCGVQGQGQGQDMFRMFLVNFRDFTPFRANTLKEVFCRLRIPTVNYNF